MWSERSDCILLKGQIIFLNEKILVRFLAPSGTPYGAKKFLFEFLDENFKVDVEIDAE